MEVFEISKYHSEQYKKMQELAIEILNLTRNSLIVQLRFLDLALSKLQYREVPFPLPPFGFLSCDGNYIYYYPEYVIRKFKDNKEKFQREFLHMIFHCVFQHDYNANEMREELWDFASDITVENVINELQLSILDSEKSVYQNQIITGLKGQIQNITADKIYNYYDTKQKLPLATIQTLNRFFYTDDHTLWRYGSLGRAVTSYITNVLTKINSGNQGGNQQQENGNGQQQNQQQNQQNQQQNQQQDQQQNQQQDQQQNGNGQQQNQQQNQQSQGDGQPKKAKEFSFPKWMEDVLNKEMQDDQQLRDEWKEIAERMKIDLETFNKKRGNSAGNLTQNLSEVTRERYDYASFLKRFAVLGEAMKINDDEFDYIFYTYGMKLYDKMPLIEPLEYKDVKRIKEFIIAIDTSGSVQGPLVQKFIQKTYNILSQEESFFTKINIHIIQCDTEIQEDAKITNAEELKDYFDNMKLHGFGGTDFRPVFEYVEELRKNKEFKNLGGLIYFTDGYGVYPNKKTDYPTAFVFLEEDYYDREVPPWAIKLILKENEI